jgi:hypothetical protein
MQTALALELSDYGESGTFSGIFRGIVSGKNRLQGSKKNFQGWIMETKNGEKEIFALIEFESSVAKVLSNPAAFTGKECTVTVDMVEELLAGRKEPTDIIRIRDVKWTQPSARAPMVSSAAQSPPTSIESIVRSFFVAIEDHDIGTLTHLLDDSVEYYQTRPISRAAVLADIKGDWKRYQNWKARITDFQTDGAFSCTFKLSYTSMEGPRPRSSTLQCTASVNPNKPNALSKITAKVVKSTEPPLAPTAQETQYPQWIVGRWAIGDSVWHFKKDGTCVIENSSFKSPTNWSFQGDILITKDMSGAMGQQEYGLTNIQKDSFKMNVRGKYSVDARRIE